MASSDVQALSQSRNANLWTFRGHERSTSRFVIVALGVITMIGSLVASGILFSHIGNISIAIGGSGFLIGGLLMISGFYAPSCSIKSGKAQEATKNETMILQEGVHDELGQNRASPASGEVTADKRSALVSASKTVSVGIMGNQGGRVVDILAQDSELQEDLILAAGGRQPGVKGIAIYPLPYQVDEKNQKISFNLVSQDAIYNDPIAFVSIDDNQFHTRSVDRTIWQDFFNAKKFASLSIHGSQVYGLEFDQLRGTLFFTSGNSMLVAIGYIDIHAILGNDVGYTLNSDNTISYGES
jgi:hypothetical protein